MKRFVEGTDRGQGTVFPECLEDWIDENHSRSGDRRFVDELDWRHWDLTGSLPR
jgi:hypothetical protein